MIARTQRETMKVRLLVGYLAGKFKDQEVLNGMCHSSRRGGFVTVREVI